MERREIRIKNDDNKKFVGDSPEKKVIEFR